jgi:release factor glutamine methyltransferase
MAGYLDGKGVSEPRLNAELLLAGVLGVRRLDLYLQFDRPLADDELAALRPRLLRRAGREPLQYIEGTAAFRELKLKVDGRVLIPRPETELLVGEVLSWSGRRADPDVVDIGTGSGAIAISLAVEGSFKRIVATDASAAALEVAADNLAATGVAANVEFRMGDAFDAVEGESFDVIVSNPPYVGESERPLLEAEVVEWEPPEALFSGADGLDMIRRLVTGAPAHLRPGGLLALEIGAGQAATVSRMIGDLGIFDARRVVRDLAGRDRMILVTLRQER